MRTRHLATRPDRARPRTRVGTILLVTLAIVSSVLTVSSPRVAAQTGSGGCAASDNFTDVPAGTYYTEAVVWAACNGITTGTSATTFSPDANVTRAQMATFLWRFAGKPAAGGHSFTDVPAGSYYDKPVGWLVQAGITTGTSATTYSPHGNVNRGQMATFLYRYAGSPATTTLSQFTDVSPSAYYARPVAWLASTGVTTGTSATTFSPNQTLTRAQMVTFLWRLDQLPSAPEPLPIWIDGNELTLESLSRFDFSFSWPTTSGAHSLQLKVTEYLSNGSPSGDVDWHGLDPRSISSFEVNNFRGYALEPDHTYRLELWAANSEGRQTLEPIELGPIGVATVKWISAETVVDPPSAGPNAATAAGTPVVHVPVPGQPGRHRATGSTSAECFPLTTRWVGEVDAGLLSSAIFGSRIVVHTVTSDLCRNGSVVTENFADFAICEVVSGQGIDSDEIVQREPATNWPNTQQIQNKWTCPLSGELGLSGQGPIEVSANFTIDVEAQHRINHIVEVVDGVFHWTAEDWQP